MSSRIAGAGTPPRVATETSNNERLSLNLRQVKQSRPHTNICGQTHKPLRRKVCPGNWTFGQVYSIDTHNSETFEARKAKPKAGWFAGSVATYLIVKLVGVQGRFL